MTGEQLEAVRMMTNHDLDSGSPLTIVLIGQPTLRRRLRLGDMAALDQRVQLRYHIPSPALTLPEASGYIRRHTEQAGRSDTLFSFVIWSSNKFSVYFRRSELSRTRPRRWLEGACERLVALLGGLAVVVAEPGGDLLPGGSCGAGIGDELVLMLVEFATLGGDGVERGQCPADGRGPGGCQRDLDIEQRDGAERVSTGGRRHHVSGGPGSWPAARRRRRRRFSPWAASSSRRSWAVSSR